jgi:hypothetical protein
MHHSPFAKNLGVGHVLCSHLSQKKLCVIDTSVSNVTPHHGPIKLKIHSPNPPLHPWLVEEVDRSHICVGCRLCIEVDILFCLVVVISVQGVTWPSHYNSMNLLGKAFTTLPQVLNKLCKRSIWLKNGNDIKLMSRFSWSMCPIFLP